MRAPRRDTGIDWLGSVPSYWQTRPLWSMFERRKDVGHPDEPMLSVFREHGVVLKSSMDNLNLTAENRNIYQLIDNGWLAVNRMKAWQGSVGISTQRGIVSGHYICFRPVHAESPRYLNWLLRSSTYTDAYRLLSRGVRPGQAEIDNDYLRTLPILLPPIDEQRRIADFLDDQVARIDRIIAARHEQLSLLETTRFGEAFAAIRGVGVPGPRRPSGLAWLGDIPEDWRITTVGAVYDVRLGKMLDESRFTGAHPVPYVRNTNVQWDHVDTTDLKVMDIEPHELARFTVRPGDLLICEGGQPGRSALWEGSLSPLGYQKALHRARARGSDDVRWLQNVLRSTVFMSVFSVENGATTIGHLTGEQLRALRIPMPTPSVQREALARLQRQFSDIDDAICLLRASAESLSEYKRSLIAAAVSGAFDVSTADGSGVRV